MDYIFDSDELVASTTPADTVNNNPHGATPAFALVRRLEQLYATLWLGLRSTVRAAFSSNSDVLEAGTAIQVHRHNVIG